LEVVVTIEFMEAVSGVEKDVTIRSLVACETCKGTGAKDGKTTSCTACKGSGRVTRAQRTPFGVIQTAAACAECHGRGAKPETTCSACNGNGVRAANRSISMRIPAGIGDGETIRLNGEGEAAPHGGSAGDLYVHVRVKSHPVFRRNANDVLSEERIPFSMFVLGGTATIETVDGTGDLHIPSGTQSGTVFKLRGHGIPFLHGHGRGDQLVTVIPEVPKKLSKEQKKLLEQLRDAEL
jgi:molecular chaperone DnaJ